MAAGAPRIKLQFEGTLGQQLVEHNLQKCWYQPPSVSHRGSQMQTVKDMIVQIQDGFSHLGDSPHLRLELEGHTILEGSTVDLFRDGDIVTVHCSQRASALEPAGNTRQRSDEPLPLVAAADSQQEPLRPKKKRKLAAATAAAAAQAANASHDAVPHDISPGNVNSTIAVPGTKKKRKVKRKRAEGQEPQQDVAEAKLHQPSQAPEKETANASGAAEDAPGADANSPAASEEKKQSRSARRKQLKRRFRRLGVAPPPQDPPSSSNQPGLVSSAAATAPSNTHDKETHVPQTSDSVPPAKRLRTQSSRLKAQAVSEGHVYFAESGSEPESAEDELATIPETADKASLSMGDKRPRGKLSEMGEAALKKQKAADTPLANGVHTSSLAEDTLPRPPPTHQTNIRPTASHQPQERAGPSMPLPETDAEYAALPAVKEPLQPGALVAYKLLEIGPDWAPQVSEWRQGQVDSSDAGTVVIKPLAGQGPQAEAPAVDEDAEEEDEEEEGPPSSYDEEGVLTTEPAALSELRLIRLSPHAAATPSATNADKTPAPTDATPNKVSSTTIQEATVAVTDPVRGFSDGNQDEAAATAADASQTEQSTSQQPEANAVPKIGAWADLSDQIARRKAELASKAGGSSAIANGVHSGGTESVVSEHKIMKVTGMQTPGAARPRGGVRASAMGPMLAFLRSSGGLGGSEA